MAPIKSIFFDVGNTLLFPNRRHIYSPLHQRNIAPDVKQLHAIECRTKNEFDALVQEGAAIDHGFWFMFYSHLLDDLAIQDNALRDCLIDATRISANWCDILPGTREILERLRRLYRIGVISNADGKIAAVLESCGIADCFLTITDSGLVGYEKPHPAIFAAALHSMNASPQESLYIGDLYSVDYLGATKSGMNGILLDVCGAYRGTGLPRVESLEELEERLNSYHQ
jgi:HAD superfamily hydrolase (TIGR01509 family)